MAASTATMTTTQGNPIAPHILVVPYPAQGHMPPLLDFACLLAARGLRLTVVATPGNLPLLSPLLAAHPSVRVLSLPFPVHPSIPAGVENAKNSPPAYFGAFIHALAALRGPLLTWMESQSDTTDRVAAILSDFFCGWTQPLAAELGIPRIVFSSSGVFGTAVLHSLFCRTPKRPESNDNEYPVAFPELPGAPVYPWRQLSMLYRTYVEGEPVSETIKNNFLWNLESWAFVSNTFWALEMRYLDAPLQDLGFRRVWAVGPVARVAPEADATGKHGRKADVAATDVCAWLDAFPEGSVVYVSFGSMAVLPPSHAAALAAALERSGTPFVWAAPAAVILPDRFEERAAAAGRGMVIRGWAPQVAVLRHPAVGWFVTHCGWNSVLEAVAAGVPMLSWPMTADQFVNARLLVDEARAAVPVCWGGMGVAPDVDEIVQVLAASVGEKGKDATVCAKEVAREAAEAVQEGGSSWRELEGLVQELWKLGVGGQVRM